MISYEEMMFAITIAFLLVFSYQDLFRKRELSGKLIFAFLAIACAYRIVLGEWIFLIPLIVLTMFGFLLNHWNQIGGGDAKLLSVIAVVLPYNGLGSLFIVVIMFIILWGILSVLYGSLFIVLGKHKKGDTIPLVPVILIAYVLVCLWAKATLGV